jgi:hypothetical protein
MKHLFSILLMTVIALTGCSDPMYPSGRFFSAFSLKEIVVNLELWKDDLLKR